VVAGKLVIVGAGGHGKAIADLAESLCVWSEIVFVDDSYPDTKEAMGFRIVGKTGDIYEGSFKNSSFIVAIGNNIVRMKLVKEITSNGMNLISITHPTAIVSKYAIIGAGVAIMAGAIVGTNASLADGCLINANSTVDHDCILESGAHLGVGVQIAGGVCIGAKAWLQAGVSAGYHTIVGEEEVIPTGTSL
jgi:sugar O-acyltransferase (sialic acid O-acetyltransferase NeuD family)